jgi:hypothetical protein
MTFSRSPAYQAVRKKSACGNFAVRLELFAGGAVSHVVACRNHPCSRQSEANRRYNPCRSSSCATPEHRVSLIREDFGSLAAGVIDSDLDGGDTGIVLGEGNETGVSTDGKIGSVFVLSDHHEVLMFAVDVIAGDCELV